MPRTSDIRVTIRVSEAEFALLQAKAGDVPLSAFMREAALGKAAKARSKQRRNADTNTKLLAQIVGLLGTHPLVAAFKDSADGGHGDKVADCEALLKEVRDLLMQALGRRQ
jgi:uncharacterized protein (DUF1778 family)